MIDVSIKDDFEYQEVIDTGENGEAIILKNFDIKQNNVTCTVIAGSNTGKMQFTTSPVSRVAAGTATWQDWAKGNVTGTASDILLFNVTAIRGVSVSGEVTVEVII
jgi:hypothetical protein